MRYTHVPLKWNGKANVCKFCGSKTKSIYIATGHDHTDGRLDLCTCGKGIDPKIEWSNYPATHPYEGVN